MRILFFCFIFLAIALPLKAQLDFEKYNEGYYIDTSSNKIFGLIRYVKGNNARIEYKKTGDAKKKKIFPSESYGFVLKDSTRFIHVDGDFTVKIGIWVVDISNDFIQVLETGKTSLYMHYSLSGDGNMQAPGVIDWQNMIVKTDSSQGYIGLHPNIKKRRKKLEDELPGKVELIEILCRKKADEVRAGVWEYNIKHSGTMKTEGSGK